MKFKKVVLLVGVLLASTAFAITAYAETATQPYEYAQSEADSPLPANLRQAFGRILDEGRLGQRIFSGERADRVPADRDEFFERFAADSIGESLGQVRQKRPGMRRFLSSRINRDGESSRSEYYGEQEVTREDVLACIENFKQDPASKINMIISLVEDVAETELNRDEIASFLEQFRQDINAVIDEILYGL